jgi:murein tripeptide amidase MpaA
MRRTRIRVQRNALLALLAAPGFAGDAGSTPILPPLAPWSGASAALVAAADDPWITPSEASDLVRTPSYDETMAWLARLAAAAPEIVLTSIGRSPEGREIALVVVSREGAATPAALAANGRPTLFAQAGIHAGEIDGKDAGLMLLRDLTVAGRLPDLLDRVNLLFVPIFNVDGHERSSRFARINQRGPEEMGWRTTARNLNLNRDYTKLDAPEMRAMIAALRAWQPALYVDLHVTDGADYQYDITYGWNGPAGHSPAIAGWLDGALRPAVDAALAAAGHVPGPFVNYVDELDPARGVVEWTADSRYSNGYGDLVRLPTVLVENHSLKGYRQRVLGTRVLLESMLRTLGERGGELAAAIAADRARRPREVPLDWAPAADEAAFELAAIAARVETSPISGGPVVRWTGEPETQRLPLVRLSRPRTLATRPVAYWIPPTYPEVRERLRLHGVEMEILAAPREVEVEMDRLSDVELARAPFEGRVRVTASTSPERRRERMPAGAARVPTDQPLGDLAILLLEPASPDSFFQWGFLLEPLQRTEYVEAYVMEPMARAMLAEDPALAAEFEARLSLADDLDEHALLRRRPSNSP